MINVQCSFYNSFAARKEQNKNDKKDNHSVPTIS
jgi:hypothetical protein